MIIAPGATSRSITVYAYNATTGLPYETAAYNDAGIALWYRRGAVGAKTAITPATLSALTDAWSSGGFKAIDENAIRLDLPDAAIAAGVTEVEVGGAATAWVLIPMTIQLETPQTGDGFARLGSAGAGLTAVPWNAAWDAEVQSEVADALGATDAITAATLSATAGAKIADIVLRRTAANIEASANGDAVSVESLYGLIMASFEAALSGTTLTVRRSDGTTLGTKTVTVDDTADPITGIT